MAKAVDAEEQKEVELNEEELKTVSGGIGMANPVAGMSFDEAYDIAWKLGRGQYKGTWETMGAAEFMKWWQESNPNVICPIDVREIFGE